MQDIFGILQVIFFWTAGISSNGSWTFWEDCPVFQKRIVATKLSDSKNRCLWLLKTRRANICIFVHNNNNKPKEYPNSNDMLGGFLRTGFGWVRDLNNSRNLTGGDWEINVKHTWRNPPKNFYEATTIWETNVKNSWQNPPQNLFWSNSRLPKKPQETVRPM